MKIGITGAFGFLGANIVAQCITQNEQVVAFYSHNTSNPLFNNSDVEARKINILDKQNVRSACKDLDALIHLAGAVDFSASMRKKVWEVNVLGSFNIYESILDLGIQKFIDTSSITALGPCLGNMLVDETNGNPYQKSNPIMFANAAETLQAVDSSIKGDYRFIQKSRLMYFDSKLAATELSRRYALERGLPVIRIFPGTAVGPGDLHYSVSQLIDSVWEGRLNLTYPGGTAFMDSRDFAKGVLLALAKGKPGDEFVLAGKTEDNLGYADFMQLIAKTAQFQKGLSAKNRRPIVLPAAIARPASFVIEQIAPKLGLSYALSLSACLTHRFSSEKAITMLGYSPKTPLEDSILACREFSQQLANSTR
jgi:dihydroflavonol-4-reductase